jgi:hypothetical protein
MQGGTSPEQAEPPAPPSSPRANFFSNIYDQALWGEGTTEQPLSGPGSRLDITEGLREILVTLVEAHGIHSMLDLGCGDMTWMPALLDDLSARNHHLTYVGADVAANQIERNRERFTDLEFCVLDMVTDPLPRADLVFCKEALNHLSIADCQAAFRNISSSGSRFLAATNYLHRDETSFDDERPGAWRYYNFLAAPFDLPRPRSMHDEQTPWNSYLALWDLPFADRVSESSPARAPEGAGS